MRFYSNTQDLRLMVKPGGYQQDPTNPGLLIPIEGTIAQFDKGQFDTSWLSLSPDEEEKVIERLRNHRNYGYPGKIRMVGKYRSRCLFWCDMDKPESVTLAEELERLRAENVALKKETGKTVVFVEKGPVEETPLLKLARLRSEAKERGIKAERNWGIEEYERALSDLKEA